jgi:hypothetical protein
MNQTRKCTATAVASYWLFTSSLLAASWLPPDHNWSISIQGGYYGLLGYGSSTHIIFGSHEDSIRVPLPIYAVAAVGLLPVGISGLFFYGKTKRRHVAA